MPVLRRDPGKRAAAGGTADAAAATAAAAAEQARLNRQHASAARGGRAAFFRRRRRRWLCGSTSGLFARPSSKHQPEAEAASMSVALVFDVVANADRLNAAGVTREKLRPVEAAFIPLTPSPGCLMTKTKLMFEAIRRKDAAAFASLVSAAHLSSCYWYMFSLIRLLTCFPSCPCVYTFRWAVLWALR